MRNAERPLFIVNVEGVVRRGDSYLLTVRSEGESHAPGTLSLPGGKVEYSDTVQDTLEYTLKREILEETGVVAGKPVYLESKWFRADDGEAVVDVVFLCEYVRGDATVRDPAEVAEVLWLTAAEVATHPKAPPWTRESIEKAERIGH
jgi:8-oxo-dGTP pyrophosphatase MutT (NUDIX family)